MVATASLSWYLVPLWGFTLLSTCCCWSWWRLKEIILYRVIYHRVYDPAKHNGTRYKSPSTCNPAINFMLCHCSYNWTTYLDDLGVRAGEVGGLVPGLLCQEYGDGVRSSSSRVLRALRWGCLRTTSLLLAGGLFSMPSVTECLDLNLMPLLAYCRWNDWSPPLRLSSEPGSLGWLISSDLECPKENFFSSSLEGSTSTGGGRRTGLDLGLGTSEGRIKYDTC